MDGVIAVLRRVALQRGIDPERVASGIDLVSEGLLDSLVLVEIMSVLEDETGPDQVDLLLKRVIRTLDDLAVCYKET